VKITKSSDIQTIASIVCDCLLKHGIEAVLSGGAVVSIYTNNEYESKDLDFISSGDMKAIKKWATQNNKAGKVQLLTPTHSVMDRLAGFFYWNDKQNLDQALMIAKRHPIKIKEIERWAKDEEESEKFEIFRKRLAQNKR